MKLSRQEKYPLMNRVQTLLLLTVSLIVFCVNPQSELKANLKTAATTLMPQDSPLMVSEARQFSTSQGTLKEGSAVTIDPAEVTGISQQEAEERFILNKVYRVEEGTAADDLFIVDEKANKWAVEEVSDATMGATTQSVALLVSGNGKVWALIQKF